MLWLLLSFELINTGPEAISDAQDPVFQFRVLPDSLRRKTMTLAGRLQEAAAQHSPSDSSLLCQGLWDV